MRMTGRERHIRGVCKTCGETLRARGGGLTPHQELGDMLSGYDWDFEPFEDEARMTDAEYVERPLGEGHTVPGGRRGGHPESWCRRRWCNPAERSASRRANRGGNKSGDGTSHGSEHPLRQSPA